MSPDSAPSAGSGGGELARIVAQSADAAELYAPVPTLLLELQTLLGTLAATVAHSTDRGRRPFRPGPEWSARVGELAYGVYLLADQTGVDVSAAVTVVARNITPNLDRRLRPDSGGDRPVPGP